MTANDNRPRRKPDADGPGGRANLAALLAVVAVAAALFWVVSAIRQHNSVQDCIDSGRHDCVSLDGR